MPKNTEQLFADFVYFAATHGYGVGYQRNPRQSVPPDCVFVRFRSPGGDFTPPPGSCSFVSGKMGLQRARRLWSAVTTRWNCK